MTKEEILKEKGITELTAFHAYPYLYRATIEAMDLYAQQQTEELVREIKRIKEERLAFATESEELRKEVESFRKEKNNELARHCFCHLHFCRIQQNDCNIVLVVHRQAKEPVIIDDGL